MPLYINFIISCDASGVRGESGWRDWGGSSRLLLKRGAIMKSLKKSRHPAVGRLIRRRSDAFVRPAEERWRIFLLQTRSRCLHAVAPPENVTFPLQAHHPPLKTARMTSSRHGSTSAGRVGGAAVDRQIRRGGSLHLLWGFFPPTALLISFALETHAATAQPTFPPQDRRIRHRCSTSLVDRCPYVWQGFKQHSGQRSWPQYPSHSAKSGLVHEPIQIATSTSPVFHF